MTWISFIFIFGKVPLESDKDKNTTNTESRIMTWISLIFIKIQQTLKTKSYAIIFLGTADLVSIQVTLKRYLCPFSGASYFQLRPLGLPEVGLV